jgi:uncharacterized membrane protein YraQ (UPF0718 family)
MDIFAPIQAMADAVVYGLLKLGRTSYAGQALDFFLYDAVKIGLLLVAINYLMAITRYYLPVTRVRDMLTGRRWFGADYLLAAILGAVTPFCSCSSIPLFIGFLGAGIPLGVTFAFLISSPLVNESSLLLFPAVFGLPTTLAYNAVGIAVSIAGGLIIQHLNMERYVEPSLLKFKNRSDIMRENKGKEPDVKTLLGIWWKDGFGITKSVYPYALAGIALGAVIHGYVPHTLIERTLGTKAWWAVPVATLIGVPLYANSVTVIPVIEALIGKGIPLGTALAFMTATVTLSFPEALILKKAMKWQLLFTFFGITTTGIMLIGYLFNLIRP